MKYILPAIIAAVLFNSCTLTKRRYMSGYSVEWRHKAPKTIVHSQPVTPPSNAIVSTHNTLTLPQEPWPAKDLNSTKTTHAPKWASLSRLKPLNLLPYANITVSHAISSPNSKTTLAPIATLQQDDKKKPVFFTGDEQEDDYARKSLVYGILSLSIPAAAFLIMWGIMLSIGGTLAYPVTYAVIIFGVGCTAGLIFALFAIINGFIAIHEINANPDMYTGKGDAILGMILAALAPIILAAYLLIRYL